MKLVFTQEADKYLEKKTVSAEKYSNIVLRPKMSDLNCTQRIEPVINFETDIKKLEGNEKIGNWNNKINIYVNPGVLPLLPNPEEIYISLRGVLIKKLHLEGGKIQTRMQCRI